MSTKRVPGAAFVSAACVSAAFVAAALVTPASLAAPADTDLGWIGRLPGLSMLTNKSTATATKTVYAVSGDVEATVESVRKGLTERGWTIRKSTNAPVAGIVARTVVAEKDGARLKVAASDVMGVSHLTLTLRGGSAAADEAEDDDAAVAAATAQPAGAPATAPAAAPAAAPAPAPREGSGDSPRPLALVDNRLEGSYDCADRDVTVGGDRCRITLRGACRSLEVLGNSNRVFVDGSVRAIRTLGERNEITWSAAKNPRRPKVTTLGGRNRVGADDQR